jgi:hypothetical protein
VITTPAHHYGVAFCDEVWFNGVMETTPTIKPVTNPTTPDISYEHLDGEPCAEGPERSDDALCAAHGRLWRLS